MSYQAKVFRILIASPNDVTDERDLVTRCIPEWNDLNSLERKVVLLPMRWETHSRPEFGRRPQEIINTTVVDHCDLLIGIFWTRLGTETGVSPSGTVEEIERVAKAGRPVMLYFSKAKIDPEKIDLAQLGKLKEFKQQTYPNALIECYNDVIDFSDKLSRHLEMKVRELISELAGEPDVSPESGPAIADLKIELIDFQSGKPVGSELTIDAHCVDMADFRSIPDYKPEAKPALKSDERLGLLSLYDVGSVGLPNTDFYRHVVLEVFQEQLFRPVQLVLQNIGLIGIRDIHIDIDLQCDQTEFYFLEPSMILSKAQQSRVLLGAGFSDFDRILTKSGSWSTSIEFPAIQPKRAINSDVIGYIGAPSSATISLKATIYGDCFPDPRHKDLTISFHVEPVATATEVFEAFRKAKSEREGAS